MSILILSFFVAGAKFIFCSIADYDLRVGGLIKWASASLMIDF